MMSPKISVIIPCYNQGVYVDEAVASCLLQSFQDFEILVLDDGSEDPATRALFADYRRPKTRFFPGSHLGIIQTRNRGVRESSGEYLCFLDADDRLHPEYFEKAVRVLEAEEETSFVSCWVEAFGDESWVYRPERCDLVKVLAECTVATPALVRREAIVEVGGYDQRFEEGEEDWDIWINLVSHGFQGRILPEVLFFYRRRRVGSRVEHCFYTDAHIKLMEALFRKYAPLYEEHLDAVLENQQKEIRELEANHEWLKQHLKQDVRPHLKRLCAEIGDPL